MDVFIKVNMTFPYSSHARHLEIWLIAVCNVFRAISWARKYGLRIYLDLHAVPGSQNGWKSVVVSLPTYLTAIDIAGEKNFDY